MKKYIALLALLLVGTVYADIAPVGKGQTQQTIELLGNPGFEAGKARWTTSSTAFTLISGTGNAYLGTSAQWQPAGSSETLSSSQLPSGGLANSGLQGKSCVGSIIYKTAEATNLYTLRVLDGSSNVLSTQTLGQTGGIFQVAYAPFLCPTSGTVQLQILGAATAPSSPIYLDNMHLGSDTRLSTVSQSRLAAEVHITPGASCNYTESAGAATLFGGATTCGAPVVDVQGAGFTVDTTTTQTALTTLVNAPPGIYIVTAKAAVASSVSSRNVLYIGDGTTVGNPFDFFQSANTVGDERTSVVQGVFNYTNSGTHSFGVYGAIIGSGSMTLNNSASNGRMLSFTITYSPTSTDTTYRSDSVAESWSGYTSGTWSTSSTTYADPAYSSGYGFTELKNRNMGSVTETSQTPTLTFTPSRTGRYLVCANSYMQQSGTSIYASARLIESNSSYTIAENGIRTGTGGGSAEGQVPLCGILDVASITSQTLKVQIKTSNAANNATLYSGNQRSSIEWSIFQLDAGQSTVIVPGNITSNTSGTERIERATLSLPSSGTLSITSQSGSWLSVAASGLSIPVTFAANEFSAAPSCTITCSNTPSGGVVTGQVTSAGITTSGATFGCINASSASTASTYIYLVCMGPR